MALWLVRAGSRGEREEFDLQNGVAVIGWGELPDLSNIQHRSELTELLEELYPEAGKARRSHWESQVWPFVQVMQIGDLVALPLKQRPVVAIGRIESHYEYRPENGYDAKHQRKVKWLKEVPRSQIASAHRSSLGAYMTVCRLQAHGIEEAFQAFLSGAAIPLGNGQVEDAGPLGIDLRAAADDAIREYIATHFKSHDFERLVEAVLQAKGYVVKRTTKGGDGGVDLVAGYGPLGFDPPRIVVQVKSEDAAIDVKVLRELKGVLKDFGADHGLIVAWGGFKGTFDKEAMRHHFEIRLWTGDDLIREVQEVYERLPEAIRAELPMKRIWTLALEGE